MIHFANLVFFFIASTTNSEGRIVQAIIGRNVSITFTLITNASINIYHDSFRFLSVWTDGDHLLVSQKQQTVRVFVDISTQGRIIVTADFLNITTGDAGRYSVKSQWDSKELNDSVVLRTIAESMIPRIDAAWHMSEESSLVLHCITSSLLANNISWKWNSSLKRNQDRYSLDNDSLTIRNLTADDQYTSYTCMDQESELESDPYQIKAFGPDVIDFTPKVTIAFEQNDLNISCNSDCSPVCKWQWTRTDPISRLEKAVSSDTVLKLHNITRIDAGNYSCNVHNILSGRSFSSYLSLDVKDSEYEIITTTIQKDESEAAAYSYYVTTAKAHNYDTDINAFPSMHMLMYFLSGFGVLSALGLFIFLFKKIRECITVHRREETLPDKDLAENYWTIVSNAKGELTTAVETNIVQINEQAANFTNTVAEINELEASSQLYTLDVDIELDGYIHPISSNPLDSVSASSQLT